MLRDENSKLRVIAIANMQYKVNHASYLLVWDSCADSLFGEKGKWVLEEEVDESVALKFVVSADVAEDKCQTWSTYRLDSAAPIQARKIYDI